MRNWLSFSLFPSASSLTYLSFLLALPYFCCVIFEIIVCPTPYDLFYFLYFQYFQIWFSILFNYDTYPPLSKLILHFIGGKKLHLSYLSPKQWNLVYSFLWNITAVHVPCLKIKWTQHYKSWCHYSNVYAYMIWWSQFSVQKTLANKICQQYTLMLIFYIFS